MIESASDQNQSEFPRAIAHVDLDAFFCSVEVLKNPDLRDKPIVVGGKAENRGVVAAASYPVREYGVHSAMSMYQAQKRCPDLIICPPHFKAYKTYSRIIMGMLRTVSPVMQQVGVDEAYLDLTDQINYWTAAEEKLRAIQQKIVRDIGLTASVGLSTSKMIAKIASDYEKPFGLTVVLPGREISFLAPLAVGKIPGIGPKTVIQLANMGIITVNDLAQKSEYELATKFGKWGRDMYRWARGIDSRPVAEVQGAKSVSTERTFSKDISDQGELLAIIEKLSHQVAKQLAKSDQKGRTVNIKVRYADFETYTRQVSLNKYTCEAGDIINAAKDLFKQSWIIGSALRLLGVGVSNFSQPDRQMALKL
ncbi:MAG: DNA polymerase IV [Candidatus Marinimicrobia bacterium]|nr:DNA polymerase IV [Candidatus Neomarinimicrobiota bacterium]